MNVLGRRDDDDDDPEAQDITVFFLVSVCYEQKLLVSVCYEQGY